MKKTLLPTISFFLLSWWASTDSLAGNDLEKAIFAGGCFWCMEADFEKISGIKEVVSGYIGGTGKDPTYNNYGKSGHIEAVQILYEPSVISYADLLKIFWLKIDPTDKDGQFCDRGHEYSSAVFYLSTEQKKMAAESKTLLDKSGMLQEPVKTVIRIAGEFYPAEDYHQNYYKKNKLRYHYYRFRCGRDQRLEDLWGEKTGRTKIFKKTSKYKILGRDELKKKLTPLQFEVTQNGGTEPPFRNKFWNNKKEGIYVDIVSGEPLFSSTDKYKSGTGWPSFTKPLDGAGIIKKVDNSWFYIRTEIRSGYADSHLGHVFNDGPKPGGLRYCVNSAALRFISKNDVANEGYHIYRTLFQN